MDIPLLGVMLLHDVVYSDCALKVKPRSTLVYETALEITKPTLVKDLSINGITGTSDYVQTCGCVTVRLHNDSLSTVVVKKGTPLAEISCAEGVSIAYGS